MKATDRWNQFLKAIQKSKTLTLVGPFAAAEMAWPKPTVFVDRGNKFQTPDPLHISVGDGDSAARAIDQPLPRAKDYSDLAFALSQIPRSVTHVDLHGFLGGRRDHEWINFGEVYRFLESRSKPCLCRFDQVIEVFGAGRWDFEVQGVFSLFTLKSTRIQLSGACRYPITGKSKLTPLSSQGLSNEGSGKIRLHCDHPVVMFRNPTI